MGILQSIDLRAFSRFAAVVITAFALTACASQRQHADYHPAPGASVFVPVKRGDTPAIIAQRYQVQEEDIVALNNIYDRDAKISDKSVRIPAYGHLREPGSEQGGRRRNAVVQTRPLAAPGKKGGQGAKLVKDDKDAPAGRGARTTAAPDKKPGKPQGVRFEQKDDRRVAATETIEQKPLPPARQAAPVEGRKFLWPVRGPLLSSFGAGNGFARNDGINIAATKGTPVRAADSGTVTYVGNELKGYGNLVLIRHDSGYVTAYAHSDTVTVQRGDRVTRGQIIAYAGATGDVTQPQLHFELRLNAKPVDPTPYLVVSNS
jgi:murein DD-endopeptidase MepM/ murein hydrolase activator NlpD